MFKSEANMTKPTARWMQSEGLLVKPEFITPWGMCDLVGLSFKERSVSYRRRLGQRLPVSSLTRAALLFRIPDDKTITLRSLARQCAPMIPEEVLNEHMQRLIDDGFVRCSSGDHLQRLNGWVPLHKRLIAVELKLKRVEEAMSQAQNNLIFADESYVGLPKDLAVRVAAKRARWSSFLDNGVGVLAVAPRACTVVIPSRHRSSVPDPVVQFYCVEKLWRAFPKGS